MLGDPAVHGRGYKPIHSFFRSPRQAAEIKQLFDQTNIGQRILSDTPLSDWASNFRDRNTGNYVFTRPIDWTRESGKFTILGKDIRTDHKVDTYKYDVTRLTREGFISSTPFLQAVTAVFNENKELITFYPDRADNG